MRLKDFFEITNKKDLYGKLISIDVINSYYSNYCFQNENVIEDELYRRNEQRLAGVYGKSELKYGIQSCFMFGYDKLKSQVKRGKEVIDLNFSDFPSIPVDKLKELGLAGVKQGSSVDVYGLHGLTLRFEVHDDEINHVGLYSDWGSVDDRVHRTEPYKDIARRVYDSDYNKLKTMIENRGMSHAEVDFDLMK